MLFRSNIVDFATKYQFLSAITRHDSQLIRSVSDELSAIQEKKESLEKDRREASALRQTLEQKRDELASLEAESLSVLKELQNQQQEIGNQLEQNEKEDAEMEAEMGRLQLQWQEEKDKLTPTPTPTPKPNPQPTPAPSPGGGGEQSSGYTWPVPGFPKVGDGWMGGGRIHRGIDIVGAGIYGAPIVAAQSGTVITAYTSDTWRSEEHTSELQSR